MSSETALSPVTLALPSEGKPSLSVEVLPYGVTVHKLLVDIEGQIHDLLIGPEDAEDFSDKNHRFHNTIVGRYSNRIPTGKFNIERNGVKSVFESIANPGGNPAASLHGGPKGFDDVEWKVSVPAKATLFSEKELASLAGIESAVLFSHVSEDGDQGFPGKLLTEVVAALLPPKEKASVDGEKTIGSVLLVYRAKLIDGKKTVTPVNLTQHWGFNLEASIPNRDRTMLTVKNHLLDMKDATHIVEVDKNQLSTGKLLPVKGTAHHHGPKLIGERYPNPGYDHFYVFDQSAYDSVAAKSPGRVDLKDFSKLDLINQIIDLHKKKATPLADLSSERSGLRLSFYSNQSGCQFYSGVAVTADSSRKKIHGGEGILGTGNGYNPGCAAFFEFHEPLAAFLNPETSFSGNDTLLTSDELYNNWVLVDVKYRKPKAL